jgi:hypothetical protein
MKGRTERTPEKIEEVIQWVAKGLSLTGACEASKIGRTTFYDWMADDPTIRPRLDKAYDEGTDVLEDALVRRALDQDTTALIFALKGRRPSRWRERYSVDNQQATDIRVTWVSEGARQEVKSGDE